MEITPQQNERLASTIRQLRRSPEFAFIRQIILAETGKDQPDLQGLKAHLVEKLGVALDEEIGALKSRRASEMARV